MRNTETTGGIKESKGRAMKIAFLGMGIMGSRMAHRLLEEGHSLRIYNRSSNQRMKDLASGGATICESPAQAAASAELTITMLSNPEAVRAVALGETGLLNGAPRGSIWMDCSTVDPEFSREMGNQAHQAGLHFLDCPVAGSKIPAEKGELVILAGGEAKDVEAVSSITAVLGKRTVHCGPVGSGSAMKLVINFMLAQSVLAMSEAAQIGKLLGLSERSILDVVPATPVAAPIIAGLRDRFEEKDKEVHFPLKHMLKDLKLAEKSKGTDSSALPLLEAGIAVYQEMLQEGTDQDFSEVYLRFR